MMTFNEYITKHPGKAVSQLYREWLKAEKDYELDPKYVVHPMTQEQADLFFDARHEAKVRSGRGY